MFGASLFCNNFNTFYNFICIFLFAVSQNPIKKQNETHLDTWICIVAAVYGEYIFALYN